MIKNNYWKVILRYFFGKLNNKKCIFFVDWFFYLNKFFNVFR